MANPPVMYVDPRLAGGNDASADLPRANISSLEAFVNEVRMFLRDYPELNRLVTGEVHTNRMIVWAIADALDDFNTTPPFTRFGLKDFPSMSLLLRGTVINLLESEGLLQTRNQLSFSDGGITINVNDKTPLIMSWLQIFKNSYEDKKQRLKVAYNIESGWGGGISSEYWFTNSYYGDW